MTAPGKLEVGPDHRVRGPAVITCNDPFPTPNGSWDSGAMRGLVLHTMAGNLPGTISWFNNPQSQASAWFGVDQQGAIHQFGPLGAGWMAWAQAAGNPAWYSVEMADDGDPANPLTAAQITAGAQLLEMLSRFAGFPLQITDDPVNGHGLITHGDGGEAWGGHFQCPGDVRRAQRPQIIALAMSIRQEKPVTASQPAVREWVTGGMSSLASLASQERTDPAAILHLTAAHGPYPADVAAYVNGVFAGTVSPSAPMPKGLALYLPG
jgi:N-acetylmuramoyl-L-alanine amidase